MAPLPRQNRAAAWSRPALPPPARRRGLLVSRMAADAAVNWRDDPDVAWINVMVPAGDGSLDPTGEDFRAYTPEALALLAQHPRHLYGRMGGPHNCDYLVWRAVPDPEDDVEWLKRYIVRTLENVFRCQGLRRQDYQNQTIDGVHVPRLTPLWEAFDSGVTACFRRSPEAPPPQ